MDTSQELIKLKIELVMLRMNKVTKQKHEKQKIKKIQHRISQILQLNTNITNA